MANQISQPSAQVSATPASLPALAAPTGVAAAAGSSQVTLTWGAVAGAAVYNVYRGTASGAELFLVTTGATSFIDYSVVNGTTYYYQVATVSTQGLSYAVGVGPLSTEVSATPVLVSPSAPPAQTVPSAPTGVVAAPGVSQVVLTWNVTNQATYYRVYRSTTSGKEAFLATSTALTYTDTSVTAGTTYYYKVAAVNSSGISALSAEVPALPVSALGTLPTPTGLTASAGDGTVVLTWNAVAGATGYNVYRTTISGRESVILASVTGTTYTDMGPLMTDGQTYFYEVVATG